MLVEQIPKNTHIFLNMGAKVTKKLQTESKWLEKKHVLYNYLSNQLNETLYNYKKQYGTDSIGLCRIANGFQIN